MPTRLALTHPANWGQYRFDNDSIVCAYDLGGGTFDCALLKKTGTGIGFEPVGQPHGLATFGGIDLDADPKHAVALGAAIITGTPGPTATQPGTAQTSTAAPLNVVQLDGVPLATKSADAKSAITDSAITIPEPASPTMATQGRENTPLAKGTKSNTTTANSPHRWLGAIAGVALVTAIISLVTLRSANNESDVGSVADTIEVGDKPWRIAAAQDRVWITNNAEGSVSVIELTSKEVIATIKVGNRPFGIATTQDHVWITNLGDGTVSVIKKP